jgi:putative transposase
MSQSYYKIWLHVVWGTKDRFPFLTTKIRKELYNHMKETAKEKGYHLSLVNGTDNHVHCLFAIRPKISISKMINDVKGESSHWINNCNFLKVRFSWQRGFGAFSVSESQVKKVWEYILNQEEHHQNVSFSEEWDMLLKKHHIEEL